MLNPRALFAACYHSALLPNISWEAVGDEYFRVVPTNVGKPNWTWYNQEQGIEVRIYRRSITIIHKTNIHVTDTYPNVIDNSTTINFSEEHTISAKLLEVNRPI